MTKITFVIPYLECKERVERAIASTPMPENVVFETTHIIGSRRATAESLDSDIIISRGITYSALKENEGRYQTIEIAVTGYDLMDAVSKLVARYNSKKIAIILSDTVFINKEFVEQIFNVETDVFVIKNDDQARVSYEMMKKSGKYDGLVSGLTVNGLANADNFPAVRIETGGEAIKNAINEALTAVYASHKEKHKTELLNSVVEGSSEGVLAIDGNMKILVMNEGCKKILGVEGPSPIGKSILNYVNTAVLQGDSENSVQKIKGKMVIIKQIPINVDGSREGVIFNFQYVDKLQKTEIDVRQKLSQKGLVAKYRFDDLVGNSSEIKKSIESAKKYARTESDILIIGETGTGKELFAQSIHNFSERKAQPFVALNCAAIAENLLESELFGYVEGAFTGASKGGKSGLFELAHKGTLFLDEVAELPITLQAKLLRALQEKEIRRMGDDKIIPVDVRIIAATNVSLKKRVEQNKFRQDLLYRLDILNLRIPPLRMRKEDILPLTNTFFKIFSQRGITLQSGALEELQKYNWRGNIRELRNICERLSVLSIDGVITRANIIENLYEEEMEDITPTAEEEIISSLIKKKRTKEEIARAVGVSRTTLWRKLKEQNK